MDSHPNDVVVMEYHMSWPGYDPFYYHNTSDNDLRRNFCSVNYVPWVVVDGNGDVGSGGMSGQYNTRIATDTDVSIHISGSYDSGTRDVNVSVTATTTSELPTGAVQYRLYVALTEDDLYYAGSNGVVWHHNVMRDMFLNGNGNVVSFVGSLPQSATRDFQFTLNAAYASENCRIVAWLQEAISKEVYNAGWEYVEDLVPTDVATAPVLYELGRNFPNPFNPKTTIPVRMAESGQMLVEVLSADGRRVAVLHDGQLESGSHDFNWDGLDQSGRRVSSGIYMAKITGKLGSQSQRMVLMK